MTKRERVMAAIRHKQPDFAPHHIEFTEAAATRMADFDPEYRNKLNNHIDSVYYDGFLTEVAPEFWRDDFGVMWNRTGADKDIGVIEGVLIPEPDITLYSFPELDEARLRAEYQAMMGRDDGRFKFGMIGFSMYERAWTLRGMENLLVDMLAESEFVEQLLDGILEYNLNVIRLALEYGIDGFHFGDDWGQQKGLIMGPAHWRRFIKPRMAKMYAAVKSAGKIVSQHSCGDIEEIFPDLIEIGLDVYQTFQPEIYDMGKVKREFGSDLTFWGGISTQRLLPYASPAEVRRVTGETIRIMGTGGGYIAAPTHAVPGDVPPENVLAMLEVFNDQG